MGTNEFIEKVNELLDLWTKINIKDLENSKSIINVINCYKFENNQELENISQKHGYILKTQGIEEIYNEQFLKKAN